MSVRLTERDLANMNLTVNGDGTALMPVGDADLPTETMTDAELLAYAAKQDGIYHDLSRRAVIPFFRRGWALSIIFERHKGRWTEFCKENGIGRTWATHARHFYAHYKEESAIPSGKTLNELLIEAGIIVQKVNKPKPKPKPKPAEKGKGGGPGGEESDDALLDEDAFGDDAADNGQRNGTDAPPKEDSLLRLLAGVKDLLTLRYENRDQIDWSKEDLSACKEMTWEIISACDDWINEVSDHELQRAS